MGDPRLRVRGYVAEECWRIVEPVLSAWRRNVLPMARTDLPTSKAFKHIDAHLTFAADTTEILCEEWAGRNTGAMEIKPTRLAESTRQRSGPFRTVGRVLLGGFLAAAGIGHLTALRQEFQAQVPPWIPLDPDFVVVASGVVEVGLGAALIVAPRALRPAVGWVAAAFFVAIFPGNIAQYATRTDAFGLTSDEARLVRLFFQPILVAWALWATGPRGVNPPGTFRATP